MKKIVTTLLILSSILYSYGQQSGCDDNRYFNTVFENITISSDVQYGQNTSIGGNAIELRMDIYEPEGDVLEKRPLIVFAHGGGFVSGNKADFNSLCGDFAKRGFVTASISYRLIDTPIPDSLRAVGIVMAIGDMKAAIRYFREDAATLNNYRIDPDYIFSAGASAGAIMASSVGYMDDTDDIDPSLMAIINATGGWEGNSSMNTQYSSEVQGVLNYSGALAESSYIDANDPPLYSFHNELDPIVSCGFNPSNNLLEGSCLMHEVAESVGIKNKFHFYSQSSGHVRFPYHFVVYESVQFLGEILCQKAPPTTSWEETSSGFNNPGFAIFDISVVNENVVWAISTGSRFDVASQNFSRTSDGGENWTTGTIPVSDPTYTITGIFALDENLAWVHSSAIPGHNAGKIHKTADGGQTWTEQSSSFTEAGESPHGIHFFDENDGFGLAFVETGNDATRSHAGYITSDGGSTWERLSSDVYPSIPGERFNDINSDIIEARGDHIWIGMQSGKIFHSSDRGHSWEVNIINGTQIISGLAFRDELNGIAVSHFNFLFNAPFNRVFATSDSGASWTEIPAPQSTALTGIQYVEGSADASGSCGTYIVFNGFDNGRSNTAYTSDQGHTWTLISDQPVYAIEFANPEVGWAGGITHNPENGLFKWIGEPLTAVASCITGTKDQIVQDENLTIIPNPFSESVSIQLDNNWQGDLKLQVVNIIGQVVYRKSIKKQKEKDIWPLKMNNLQPGIYQILLSNGERIVSKSVIKSH